MLPSAPAPSGASATPASVLDLLVDLDGHVVVRRSDDTVHAGPIAGPLAALPALERSVELARVGRITCGRFADGSARCVDDAGEPVTPARVEGVGFLSGGAGFQAVAGAGPEVWQASSARELVVDHLPAVDGVLPTLPALESFELSRDYGCGVTASGIAFCWGMDVPFFEGEEPDQRGDFGQALFLRPRSVSPAVEVQRVEVYVGGVCLYGAGDVLRECRGTIDVRSGRLTRCAPSAPCRCGASPDRSAVACEGRSTSIDPSITSWVDGVVLLASARCFVTAHGAAGCFDGGRISPIADLPVPVR